MSWLDRLKALDSGQRGPSGSCQNRRNPGSVSFDGASEAPIPSTRGATDGIDGIDSAACEAFEERAAIMEFDGGLPREEAGRMFVVSHHAPSLKHRWPFEDWDDLRPCLLCRNLTRGGRCMAAWRGELRAARDYSPTLPDQPRRCIGYDPKAEDPDQTPGRERWPEMVSWQRRLGSDVKSEGQVHG